MAECINTTTLLKEIDHAFHTDTIGKKDVINLITNLPVADAVEVVRCRDCKYHEEEGIEMVYCPNMIGGWVENEWFCANGKRKEGAD